MRSETELNALYNILYSLHLTLYEASKTWLNYNDQYEIWMKTYKNLFFSFEQAKKNVKNDTEHLSTYVELEDTKKKCDN